MDESLSRRNGMVEQGRGLATVELVLSSINFAVLTVSIRLGLAYSIQDQAVLVARAMETVALVGKTLLKEPHCHENLCDFYCSRDLDD